MAIPQDPNQRWSLDFVSDTLTDGRRFRILCVIDDFSRRQAGVIDRIAAILNPAKAGRTLRAVVTVELRLHGEPNTRQFLDLAVREDAVAQAHAVTGDVDAVLMLRLRDMEEYDALCHRLFQDRTNVARYWTMMVIRTAKDETAIPL